MIDIRDNAIVGMINFEDAMVPASLHFSEWWNGEGMDVNYYWSKEPVASWADTANGVKCLVIARFP